MSTTKKKFNIEDVPLKPGMAPPKYSLQVMLPHRTGEALKRRATNTDIPVASLVKMIINQWLRTEGEIE